jgi:hypothetical protein
VFDGILMGVVHMQFGLWSIHICLAFLSICYSFSHSEVMMIVAGVAILRLLFCGDDVFVVTY